MDSSGFLDGIDAFEAFRIQFVCAENLCAQKNGDANGALPLNDLLNQSISKIIDITYKSI